ncbi:MAG: LysM peptidoglycan-binding domain-containing protein [bacterium]|nr:LysM peptidoglycan-binding domain-containing protein [bacterium]
MRDYFVQMIRSCFLSFVSFVFIAALFVPTLEAQKHPAFVVDPRVRADVDFWKLVFARYGENQVIFHHRDHLDIIYSILDLTTLRQGVSEGEFRRRKDRALLDEEGRIRKALTNLDKGRRPSNELEQRIFTLFRKLNGVRKYREAYEDKQIRSQTGIAERFREGIVRSGRYMQFMEDIFRREGLPIELTRLPMIESSFNYEARSVVGAAGIWQFMRVTGRSYMRINASVDERLDPIIATRSASRYLGSAYNTIKSWPLAVTSYNHGVTGVLRAIKATGERDWVKVIRTYKGGAFGFASRNFFIELLAANEVYTEMKQHFPGIVLERPLQFEEVRLEQATYFSQLLKYRGASASNLQMMNPAFLQPVISGRGAIPAGYMLKVPAGDGRAVIASLRHGRTVTPDAASQVYAGDVRQIRSTSSAVHVVSRGESLSGIARHYGLSAAEIMRANGLKNANKIRIGMKLRLPGDVVASPAQSAAPVSVAAKTPAVSTPTAMTRATSAGAKAGATSDISSSGAVHVVASGDTLGGIARRYGSGIDALANANGLSRQATLRIGQKLKLPASVSGKGKRATAPAAEKTYTVKPGDSLYAISRRLNVSLPRLKARNPGVDRMIKPGQKIKY